MPALVAVYVALFLVFCGWAYLDEIKATGFRATTAAEMAANAALLASASAYWIPAMRGMPGELLLVLYASGCAGFSLQGVLCAHKHAVDMPNSGRSFVAGAGFFLGLLLSAPLLYWGWRAAVLHTYAA